MPLLDLHRAVQQAENSPTLHIWTSTEDESDSSFVPDSLSSGSDDIPSPPLINTSCMTDPWQPAPLDSPSRMSRVLQPSVGAAAARSTVCPPSSNSTRASRSPRWFSPPSFHESARVYRSSSSSPDQHLPSTPTRLTDSRVSRSRPVSIPPRRSPRLRTPSRGSPLTSRVRTASVEITAPSASVHPKPTAVEGRIR